MLQAVCRPYVYRNRTSNDEGLICVLTYYVGKALQKISQIWGTLSRLGESEVGLQKFLLEFVALISGTFELYQPDENVNFWSGLFLECFLFLAWRPSKFNAASLHSLANFANLPPLTFSTCQPSQTSFFSHNSSLNLLNYTKSFFFGLTIKHFTRAQKYCTQMSFVTFVTNSMSAQVIPSVLLALVLNVPRMLEMSPVKTHNWLNRSLLKRYFHPGSVSSIDATN